MKRTTITKTILLTTLVLSLVACGKPEVKTGSLIQRFTMVDQEGRQFGTVEMDPINGGMVTDINGRVVGKITPPSTPMTVTADSSGGLAPLQQSGYAPY